MSRVRDRRSRRRRCRGHARRAGRRRRRRRRGSRRRRCRGHARRTQDGGADGGAEGPADGGAEGTPASRTAVPTAAPTAEPAHLLMSDELDDGRPGGDPGPAASSSDDRPALARIVGRRRRLRRARLGPRAAAAEGGRPGRLRRPAQRGVGRRAGRPSAACAPRSSGSPRTAPPPRNADFTAPGGTGRRHRRPGQRRQAQRASSPAAPPSCSRPCTASGPRSSTSASSWPPTSAIPCRPTPTSRRRRTRASTTTTTSTTSSCSRSPGASGGPSTRPCTPRRCATSRGPTGATPYAAGPSEAPRHRDRPRAGRRALPAPRLPPLRHRARRRHRPPDPRRPQLDPLRRGRGAGRPGARAARRRRGGARRRSPSGPSLAADELDAELVVGQAPRRARRDRPGRRRRPDAGAADGPTQRAAPLGPLAQHALAASLTETPPCACATTSTPALDGGAAVLPGRPGAGRRDARRRPQATAGRRRPLGRRPRAGRRPDAGRGGAGRRRMTFRCSEGPPERGDPLLGTAPPQRDWLLVEHPGPWPVTAPFGADLSDRPPATARASRPAHAASSDRTARRRRRPRWPARDGGSAATTASCAPGPGSGPTTCWSRWSPTPGTLAPRPVAARLHPRSCTTCAAPSRVGPVAAALSARVAGRRPSSAATSAATGSPPTC